MSRSFTPSTPRTASAMREMTEIFLPSHMFGTAIKTFTRSPSI